MAVRAQAGERRGEHRRGDEQAELLIEQQARHAARNIRDVHFRIRTVRRRRIRRAVQHVEEQKPRRGRHRGKRDKGRRCPPARGRRRARALVNPHRDHGAEARSDHRESRVHPRQQTQCRRHGHQPRLEPPAPSLEIPENRQRSGGHTGAGAIGKDRHALHEKRGGADDRRPCEPGGGAVARGQPADRPHQRAGQRGHEHDDRLRATVAEHRDGWQHDHRHAWRMNRVDGAVDARLDEVRPYVGRQMRRHVAARVVVLDLQVAIAQQALRDHEVVRLVARRQTRRQTGGRGDERERREDASGRRGAARPGRAQRFEAAQAQQRGRQRHEPDRHPRGPSRPHQHDGWPRHRQPRQYGKERGQCEQRPRAKRRTQACRGQREDEPPG